jgi:hypothetical protein
MRLTKASPVARAASLSGLAGGLHPHRSDPNAELIGAQLGPCLPLARSGEHRPAAGTVPTRSPETTSGT